MLVILHISWRQRNVNVWGEQAAIKHVPCPEAGKQTQTRVSPYDAGSAALSRLLKGFLWDTAELQMSAHDLRLPTFRTSAGLSPMPSQPFLMPDAAPREPPVSLDTWRVSAASLTWKQAFTFLGACQERRLADGVFAGEDLLAFSHLYRFAGSLVARGRFLPALARRDARMHFGTMPREKGAPCPDIARIRDALLASGTRTAWLSPFFTVAGAHACCDLAGDTPGSWRGVLEASGIRCRPLLAGLIEQPALAAIWRDHLQTALTRLP